MLVHVYMCTDPKLWHHWQGHAQESYSQWHFLGDDLMTARLPSNPERMVPGAPVLLEPCLAIQHKMIEQEGWKAQRGTVRMKRNGENAGQEQLWLLLGACVFPAFLVLPLASSCQLILNKMRTG